MLSAPGCTTGACGVSKLHEYDVWHRSFSLWIPSL